MCTHVTGALHTQCKNAAEGQLAPSTGRGNAHQGHFFYSSHFMYTLYSQIVSKHMRNGLARGRSNVKPQQRSFSRGTVSVCDNAACVTCKTRSSRVKHNATFLFNCSARCAIGQAVTDSDSAACIGNKIAPAAAPSPSTVAAIPASTTAIASITSTAAATAATDPQQQQQCQRQLRHRDSAACCHSASATK